METLYVTLGSYNYILAGTSILLKSLKTLSDRHKNSAEEAQVQARKDYMNEITNRRWKFHSKAYKTYLNLIKHLRKNPKDSAKVSEVLSRYKTFRSRLKAFERSSISIEYFIPGENAYESPDKLPRMTHMPIITIPVSKPPP